VALSTVAAIRDQCHTIIEALTPTSLSADKFRRYRNESGADFDADMEANPAGAFRRFQIRQVNLDEPPLVSNVTEERVPLDLEIRIAYPQTHRYGADNAMDRDDVRNQDWKSINYKIGIYGRANFSSTHDCTPLGATMELDIGDAVDFMVIRARFEYLRAIA
jgi:hypothetical protein